MQEAALTVNCNSRNNSSSVNNIDKEKQAGVRGVAGFPATATSAAAAAAAAATAAATPINNNKKQQQQTTTTHTLAHRLWEGRARD